MSSESVRAKSRAARQFAHGAELEEPIEHPARSAVREPRRPRRAGQRNGVVGEQQLDDAAGALGVEFRRDRQQPVQRRAPTRPAPPTRRCRPARPANPDRSAAGVGSERYAAPAAYALRRRRPAAHQARISASERRVVGTFAPARRQPSPPRRVADRDPRERFGARRRAPATRDWGAIDDRGGGRECGGVQRRRSALRRRAIIGERGRLSWSRPRRRRGARRRARRLRPRASATTSPTRYACGRNASAKLTSLAGLTSIPNGCSELCGSLYRRPRTFPQRDRRATARRSRWRHAIGHRQVSPCLSP